MVDLTLLLPSKVRYLNHYFALPHAFAYFFVVFDKTMYLLTLHELDHLFNPSNSTLPFLDDKKNKWILGCTRYNILTTNEGP